ncbi:MAG: formylglycine-generating enzyme family protein [Chloroflexi bacterium]|nr:formylglycine-generating enzyme family protein [Chloroflexota bacterium]
MSDQNLDANMDTTDEEVIPFMSFVSFRDTHQELQKKRRKETKGQESDQFWEEVLVFLERGEAAGAFLDNDEDRDAAQSLLDYWQNQLFHANRDAPDALLADFDPMLQPEIPDSRCPYIGLHAFDASNEHLFYGRDQLINQILNQILVSRMVTAVGSSGSGKSSVVLAGVIPRLKNGELPGSALWHYYPTMVPGSVPLTNLALTLMPEGADKSEWVNEQTALFQENPEHLTQLIQSQTDEPGILVIDQFEEAFTLCHDEAERDAFLENLLNLIRTRETRHVVILTMRVDYESYLNKTPLFQSLYEQGLVRVTAMSGAELREAIENPADAVGLKFEEGLVDALIREIVGEPAALPLLQFTLLQLWDDRERNRVTWEAYRRLGGVTQALANTADNLYLSLLPEEQVTVKRILLRLVRPSAGLEFTRARIPRRMLYETGEAQDRVDRVLDRLIEARLVQSTTGLTRDDDQIEVAHEALVRNWPRLVEWLEDERVTLRHRLRLSRLAEDWDARDRDESMLLRGAMLQETAQYQDLSPLEKEFIDASEQLAHKEEREKEEIRQRELAQARQLAAEQQKAASRLRWLSLALALLIGIVFFTGILLLRQERARSTALVIMVTATAEKIVQQTENARLVLGSTAQAAESEENVATATAAAATAQAIAAERSRVNSDATSTAVHATSTAAQMEAQSTATAIAQTPAATSGSILSAGPTATPNPEELKSIADINAILRPEDNMRMLFISGGTFDMGSDARNAETDERPSHTVTVPDFYIDQFEVSVQQYADFLNQLGGNRGACDGFDCAKSQVDTIFSNLLNNYGFYEARPGAESYPINWISWYGASVYCQSMGMRLPTEAEWEYAARGLDGRPYPWGSNQPDETNAVFGYTERIQWAREFDNAFLPVNALPNGRSPFGVYGMAGGVSEWVEDWYDPNYYKNLPRDAAANEERVTEARVVRGGNWTSPAEGLLTYRRDSLPPIIKNPEEFLYIGTGFRCADDTD